MFSGSATSLFLGLLLSVFGTAYIAYGKRAAELPWLAAGFALLLFPMFVSSVATLLLLGGALALAPWLGQSLGWW